ncbi:MAG: AbrB/MazE/SpoVT family DNA-binding domain-containing protein [Acidimicrobiia bacterium]
MRTTIDKAGRLVIPKPIRERLGLKGGEDLEVVERDGQIEIRPGPTPMWLVEAESGPVAVPERELPPLTDEMVRDLLEQTRR